MKKLFYILLLFTGIVNAQIGINNPTPFNVCEATPNSGVALFYLPFKNTEIFGNLNVNNYTVQYYSDAATSISINTPYFSSNTTIYIKVIDNSNPTIFQITSLDLVVNPKPNPIMTVVQPTCSGVSSVTFTGLPAGDWYLKINDSNGMITYSGTTHTISNVLPGTYTYQIFTSACSSEVYTVIISTPSGVPVLSQTSELHNYENPFDGTISFNLTSQQNSIIGNQTGIDLIYFTNSIDAQNNTNQITNPTTYQNTSNPQTIWVRAVNAATSCYQLTNFSIKVFDSSTVVYIPDANFKARLLSADSANHIAFVQVGGSGYYGQIDLNLDGEIQNTEALNVNELNVNSQNFSNQKINDLTGIEYFTEISNLNCSHNLLTTLNITPLINNFLYSLDCSYNNLSNFNFNSLGSNISGLDCSGNNISVLNISNLTNLHGLSCSFNQLTV